MKLIWKPEHFGYQIFDLSRANWISVDSKTITIGYDDGVARVHLSEELSEQQQEQLAVYLAALKNVEDIRMIESLIADLRGAGDGHKGKAIQG